MILVDTSVWIDHLRFRNVKLVRLLEEDQVLMHPWVAGELALGSLNNRRAFIDLLSALPAAAGAADPEIFACIEKRHWYARGIGWVDAGLLTSALQYPCGIYTQDKRLAQIAQENEIPCVQSGDYEPAL